MSHVVSLDERRQEKNPHRSGPARCMNCKHEWEAVAPIGVTALECPKCLTSHGLYKGMSMTEFDQWQCKCGERMFFIDVHGPYCAHCGHRPVFP